MRFSTKPEREHRRGPSPLNSGRMANSPSSGPGASSRKVLYRHDRAGTFSITYSSFPRSRRSVPGSRRTAVAVLRAWKIINSAPSAPCSADSDLVAREKASYFREMLLVCVLQAPQVENCSVASLAAPGGVRSWLFISFLDRLPATRAGRAANFFSDETCHQRLKDLSLRNRSIGRSSASAR